MLLTGSVVSFSLIETGGSIASSSIGIPPERYMLSGISARMRSSSESSLLFRRAIGVKGMPSDDAVDSCVELVAADDISAGRELGGCFPFNQLPGIDRVSLLGDGEVRIQELDDTVVVVVEAVGAGQPEMSSPGLATRELS